MFTLGAYAIIFDVQKRVLLCHRCDFDLWNLPGGGIEVGELPSEAVVRETREETGLDVVIDRLVGVYAKPDDERELVFAFQCTITGGEIATTAEADKIEYFEFDKMPRNTVPRHVGRIVDALKFSEPVFRRQTEPSVRRSLREQSEPKF